jgi:hypothetical protein
MILYCPNCWSPIEENEEVCHESQAEIESFNHLSYFEGFVRALNHPERTTRIRFKTKKVTQAIRMALDDPSPSVQELAMKILRGRSKRGNFNGS